MLIKPYFFENTKNFCLNIFLHFEVLLLFVIFFFKLTVFAIPFYNFNFLFCSICARGSYYLSLVIGWGQVSLGLSCLLTLRVGAGQGERMGSMGIFNIGIFQTSLPHLLRYPLHEHISVTFPVLFLFVFWEFLFFFFFPNRLQRLLIMAGLLLATRGQFWAVAAAFLYILSPFSAQRQMRSDCRLFKSMI